jgi:hypothetical protein
MNDAKRLLMPSDMPALGFTLTTHNSALGVSHWAGHRLLVEISVRHVRIKMAGCGCPLVQCAEYSLVKMGALINAITL